MKGAQRIIMEIPYLNNARQGTAITYTSAQETLHAVHQAMQHYHPIYSHSIHSTGFSPTQHPLFHPVSIHGNLWYVTHLLVFLYPQSWIY
jgi:hypothetical protein